MSVSDAVQRTLDALETCGCNPRGSLEKGWDARCAAHADRNPSFHLAQSTDGHALVSCHKGCSLQEIAAALDIAVSDLFEPNGSSASKGIVEHYPYVDEDGKLLYQVVRLEPKGFRQRRPDGNSGWIWSLGKTRRVLYRLPEVLQAVKAGKTVYLVEGERDVHSLEQLGVTATTNPGGAGKWHQRYNSVLKGAVVVVIQDIDQPDKKTGRRPGQEHAQQVAEALSGVAASVKLLQPKEGKDVSDHLGAGRGLEEFEPVHSDESAEGPFALPLDEFIATKSEAPSVLVGEKDRNLVPRAGLLILFAKGGRGKTTLSLDGAFHFASGVKWLGFEVSRPLRVLIIENEGPREPFREKLEAKRQQWSLPIRGEIHIHVESWGALLLGPDSIGRLRQYIEDHQIDVVIGDPLDSLGLKGVGSPEDTREFIKLLVASGLTKDVAFWLLHHPRKADTEDELDEISGAWGGRVDSLLKLDKRDGNRARLSFPKVRWSRRGDLPAMILDFAPETESYAMVSQDEEDGDDRDYVAEVIAFMEDGHWRTAAEIANSRKAKEKPGIGAREITVFKILEARLDEFERRTGAAATEVGRHSNSTVWRLQRAPGGHVGDRQETFDLGDVSDVSPTSSHPYRSETLVGDGDDGGREVSDETREETEETQRSQQSPDEEYKAAQRRKKARDG